MATPQPDATCDTATVILNAAQARLLEFGYHKTTMAEIAADCGMSAANLYRYFANKEEIAAECATRCMNERLERLRPIVEDASTSAADKLLAYALMLVEDSHVHDTATTGIYFKGGASDVIVQRNRIENAGMSGILVGFDTSEEFFDLEANPEYYEAVRGVVRNNLIRNTGYAGIGLYAARDAVVANNTIIDAARLGHAALYFGIPFQDWDPKAGRPASVNPLIRNNLLIQHGRTCVEIRWSRELGGLSALAGSPGTDFNAYGNHGGDCRFVDMRTSGPLFGGLDLDGWRQREGSDAHSLEADIEVEADGALPAGSAAIDRGATIEQVSDDLDGRKRSPPFDIGALESAPRSP